MGINDVHAGAERGAGVVAQSTQTGEGGPGRGEVGVDYHFDIAADALESLVEDGHADLDHSALVTLIEAESGVRVADKAGED